MSVPDYHPLSVEEIEVMLHEAALAHNEHDVRLVSKIQVLLDEGIRGMEDPRPIEGPVREKMNAVDRMFLDFIESGKGHDQTDTHLMALQLHTIMEN